MHPFAAVTARLNHTAGTVIQASVRHREFCGGFVLVEQKRNPVSGQRLDGAGFVEIAVPFRRASLCASVPLGCRSMVQVKPDCAAARFVSPEQSKAAGPDAPKT